jgi:hypothetical protein
LSSRGPTWSLDGRNHIKLISAVLRRRDGLASVREEALDGGGQEFAEFGEAVVARQRGGVGALHGETSFAIVACPKTAASIAFLAASSTGRTIEWRRPLPSRRSGKLNASLPSAVRLTVTPSITIAP